jgi:hypothetical protein
MVRHQGPLLVDTNVILECWRVDAWRALSSGYRVETVEDCVIETQTGFQRRRLEQLVDKVALEASLAAPPHRPGTKELAVLAVKAPDIVLDPGERALWAHALTRNDDWILCGPDKASLRFGVRVGFSGRLAALQTLLDAIGHRPKEALRRNYTAHWHAQARHEIVMSEGIKRP